MKIKKRYLVACVFMCLAAIALGIIMFNLEMGLARYSKLNRVARSTWNETSASDLDTRLNTDLFVTKVLTDEEIAESETITWKYLGRQNIVNGKYMAYGKEVYGSDIVINDEVKMGDRISVYYKPDDPSRVYVPVSYTTYIIGIAACVVVAGVLIVICRIINKHMRDNTFSDAKITFMDIPIPAIVALVVIGFFAGMITGSLQVDRSYTEIDQSIAEGYANGEYTF